MNARLRKNQKLRRAIFAAIVVLAPTSVSAQETTPEEARARALATDLFDSGVKLMVAHKCDETQPIPEADRAACTEALGYFVKATRTYPKALGGFRNAAYVARGLGKVALAARSFRQVARLAPLEPSESRRRWAEPAKKEAELLEPQVPHLVVKLSGPTPDALHLTLDGDPFDKTLLATPIALDPGEHIIHADAPDHTPSDQKITLVPQQSAEVVLDLPAIVKAAPIVASAAPPPPPAPVARSQVAPIVVTSVGGAVIITGLIFGAIAKGTRNGGCDLTSNTCTSQSDIDKAKSQANVSTALTIAGSAIAAAGAVWWIVNPKYENAASARITPFLSPSSGGLALTVVR